MTTPPPRLPSRSNSRRTSVAPYDAAEPDDTAITDVYRSVEETGSLEAAARKLHRLNSSTSSMSSTGGTPPVIAPLATRLPSKGPVWADDPEEAGYMNEQVIHEEDDGMMGDDDEDQGRGSEDGEEEVVHMQEVMDGLWIGDLVAAMDVAGLERRGITNILSLLRPRLDFESQFATYPLEIDDTADTDILTHLPSCVAWISEALGKRQREKEEPNYARLPKPSRDKVIDKIAGETKPGGVLVHCQAGMSRSATVVLAYLMQTLSLEPVEALEILREKRPVVDPSDTFWYQLALFYNADGKVTLKDRSTRQFYMERTTSQFMNGDGGAPPLDKMAKFPATPTISNPPTPMGGHGRRKIRCKMCRRHLAVREHMMDHILDQAPISRPRTPSNFSLPSPRGSVSQVSPFTTVTEQDATITRRQSFVSDVINPLTGLPGATRRDSSASLAMTPTSGSFDNDSKDEPKLSPGGVPLPRTTTPGLTLTASSPEVHTGHKLPADVLPGKDVAQSPSAISPSTTDNGPPIASRRAFQSADQLMSTLPPHLQALRNAGGGSMSALSSPFGTSPASSPERESAPPFPASKGANANNTYPPSGAKPAPISPPVRQGRSASQSGGVGGISIATQDKPQTNPSPPETGIVRSRSQSSSSNSGTIGRRMSLLAMTPTAAGFGQQQQTGGPGSRDRRQSSSGPNEGGTIATSGPPILVNPKCSGYFVEPLTWMEPFLRNGEISGKIVCPNEKCGVKIGNYDWAGVQCGCKEWVTPGFCISRSKVDEVW